MHVRTPTQDSAVGTPAATPAATRARRWIGRTVRLLVVAALAAGTVLLALGALHGPLDLRTDIIGYPVYADFNVRDYLVTYVGWGIAFPVLVIAGYDALGRLSRPRGPGATGPSNGPAPDRVDGDAGPVASPSPSPSPGRSLGLALAIGASLGLELALSGRTWLGGASQLVLAGAVAYAALAASLGAGYARLRRRAWAPAFALVNACAAPLGVVGLALVSSRTRVVTPVRTHQHSWMPWEVAIPLALLLAAGGWLWLRGGPGRVGELERRMVTWVTGPVVIFLVTAVLPGAQDAFDVFHDGEALVAGRLLGEGLVPWKDFVGVHGWLQDGLFPLLGFEVFEPSRWGWIAATSFLIVPLYWIGIYALAAWLFRRLWPMLVAMVVLTAAGTLFASELFVTSLERLLLLPWIVLAFGLLSRRATWPRAIAFTSALVAQVVLTPEATWMLPAFGVALVLRELSVGRTSRWRVRAFPRTARCLAVGAAWGAGIAIVLLALGALDDFAWFVVTLSRGHELTGGVPIRGIGGFPFTVLVFGPPVLVGAFCWYAVAKVRAGRRLGDDDWAMVGLALFLAVYFLKGLSRGEMEHLFQPWACALILVYFLGGRLLSGADVLAARLRSRSRSWWGSPGRSRPAIGAIALVIVVATAWGDLSTQLDRGSGRFDVSAPAEPAGHHVGFIEPALDPSEQIEDVERFFDAIRRPGDEVFDFSNSPGLFHYALGLEPPTRYYHVSPAIRRVHQDDLVRRLRASRPKFVVFDSMTDGLPVWDLVVNSVRHYEVSRYLLDHYHPIAQIRGFSILVRDGTTVDLSPLASVRFVQPPVLGDVRMANHACDWGHAPQHLDLRPDPAARSVTVHRQNQGTDREIRVALPSAPATYRWIEVSRRGGLRPGRIQVLDARDASLVTTFVVSVSRPERLFVPVASCGQWRQASTELVVVPTQPQAMTIRVIA